MNMKQGSPPSIMAPKPAGKSLFLRHLTPFLLTQSAANVDPTNRVEMIKSRNIFNKLPMTKMFLSADLSWLALAFDGTGRYLQT